MCFRDGSASASSSDHPKPGPKAAFERQKIKEEPWLSGPGLPQSIFFKFQKPKKIGAFGFRNGRGSDYQWNNPASFNFVGLDACGTGEPNTDSTVLLNDDVEWSSQDQYQNWTIQAKKQRPFLCYGIEVLNVVGNDTHVAIQDIQMFEGKASPV